MHRFAALAVLLAACATIDVASATPYVPHDDAIVLERLPEKGDPSLLELKRLRVALAADPRNLSLALSVAVKALEAARTLGDPRFLGQAQAALMPWWNADDAPPDVVLLRASAKQSQHDFAGALADLDQLIARDAAPPQAFLTRATVLTVIGRYAEARSDCAALHGHASSLVVEACDAPPASLSGSAFDGYTNLVRALHHSRERAEIREWALTIAGEIAARRGDATNAESLFVEARTLDPRDPYLKAAYADFLLDHGRSAEVASLLANDLRNDGLLLRLVLAEQMLPQTSGAFERHRDELAARFDAARRRGDSMHRREEARFRLLVLKDIEGAAALARDNWRVQKEPADLRMLIVAAQASGDRTSLRTAREWIAQNGIDDVAIAALSESGK